MFVELKFDIFNSSASTAGVSALREWAAPKTSDESFSVDIFTHSFRSFEKNTNVSADQNMLSKFRRHADYAELFQALNELQQLDGDDPAAIDADTYGKSRTVLSILASTSAIPPRIFSHGGDAAVFSWADNEGVKYITVSGGLAAFARRDKGSRPVTIGIADMTESNAAEFLPHFGVIRDSSSTNSSR